MTTPMITTTTTTTTTPTPTPTPTNPTTPPPSPMHADDAVSTQPPVLCNDDETSQPPVLCNNDETSQEPDAPVNETSQPPEAPVDYNELIKRKMAEVVRDVNERAKADRVEAFKDFAKDLQTDAKACANATTYADVDIQSDKIARALELFSLRLKACLNDKAKAKLALESLSNPPTVVVPEQLPFNIIGQASTLSPPPRRGQQAFFNVNSKVARSFKDSSQGSVFMTTSSPPTTTTTDIKQRKRKRRHDKHHASSPVKPKKARANPLWTDKEINKVGRYVYAYAPHVLALNPTVTPGQFAEELSKSLSKGMHYRSPTAVVKKIRNLGLVLTNPKDKALRAYLTKNNLMQYVPKRFQAGLTPKPTTTTTTKNSCYTEEEIASVESKEPTATTTTGLAALIASIPPPPVST